MSPSCLSCKGSKWAFKQFFSYLSQETVLGMFWQALFPPLSLPYTGIYFCFGFLLEVTKQFCISSPPKFSISPILHYVLIFIVLASITFHLFLIFHTPAISPIYTHFLFQPVEKLLYDERGKKREFDILGSASSRSSLAPEPGASGIMPALGYPGHQNRVSIKAPRRRER